MMLTNARVVVVGMMTAKTLGDSAVGVDLLSKTDVECLGKTSKVNDNSQEVVTIHKSTRLKKLPNIKNQDFLW